MLFIQLWLCCNVELQEQKRPFLEIFTIPITIFLFKFYTRTEFTHVLCPVFSGYFALISIQCKARLQTQSTFQTLYCIDISVPPVYILYFTIDIDGQWPPVGSIVIASWIVNDKHHTVWFKISVTDGFLKSFVMVYKLWI